MEKKFQKLNKYNRGVATLEMLIAITIITMAISAVILLVFNSQLSGVASQTNQEAIYKAQRAIEDARATSRSNFGSVVNKTFPPDSIYTKNLIVSDIDDFTKIVTSQVTWGTGQRVSLSTIITDWFSAGDICNPNLSGDWTKPQSYGYVDFSSPKGASGVNLKNNVAYVTSDPNSSTTDDFYTINVSDPTLGPLPILGHFSTSYGLTDVRTVGTYAYVTADSATAQLLVIDVSDPKNLDTSKIKAKIDVTVSGDDAVGNTIFYADKKIYLGLTKSTGPEFHIFCIAPNASVPACSLSSAINPVEIGTYEVGAAINSIVVKNNIAYLATAANNEVIALNVSDATNPSPTGNYTSSTLTGQSLALDKTTNLYFGRIGGTGNPKLLAFDINNLSTPKWTMNMDTKSGIFAEILRGNLLFMTTSDPNDGLQIWDIANAGPTNPPTRYDTTPLNIQQTAIAGSSCVSNLLYVAQRSNRALQIIGPGS